MHCRFAPLILLATFAASAAAQKEPKRPKLLAGADTNSAAAYYQFAMGTLKSDPEKAADALYWATRLEPAAADALYARRIALLVADRSLVLKYWSGDRRTIQSDEVRRIDSLYYRALTLNPFVSQTLDRQIFEAVADEISARYERNGVANSSEVRYAIDNEMAKAGPATKAWLAYGDGRYGDALQQYATAIKADKRNEVLRLDRARVFYQMGSLDSALAEMTLGVNELRKRDKKDLVYVYQSKALSEHGIGIIERRLGHTAAAKEAFGRALQEDLAYSPAHFQLAYILLEAADTASAINEMDLAIQTKGDDPATRYAYGYVLSLTKNLAEAETQLRKAIALDNVYAAPHAALAGVLERTGRKAEALKEYRAFLGMAALTDPRRADAEAWAAALAATPEKL